MESKHQKFRRLAEARTNKAISAIRSLSKLSNKNHYDYSDDEIKKIFAVLKREISDAQTLYSASLARTNPKFNLDK
ncbi:hypothetical protein [Lentibacter sp.]|jgi:hypothetical protein|uniref:hypothetical protein n=1 Tax=Lentibacter sp. TaxID=2024994 RepID=UPI0032D8BA6E